MPPPVAMTAAVRSTVQNADRSISAICSSVCRKDMSTCRIPLTLGALPWQGKHSGTLRIFFTTDWISARPLLSRTLTSG